MRFNRNRKRFGSRLSRTSRSGSNGMNGKSLINAAQNFGSSVRGAYSEYVESITRSSSSKQEKFILFGLSIFTAGMIVLSFATVTLSLFLPSTRNAQDLLKVESTIFFDRKGQALYTVHGEENRVVVDSEDIPNVVKQAAVSIEDDGFYDHNGFDLPAIVKAVLSEVGIGRQRGGSTITQQFVKNALLSNERTYTRKFKEIILATRIERNYTKDEILTMYLNKIPYGGTAYGVQKASEVFFDKEVTALALPEAVILAALPQAPTYYSPFGNNKYSSLNKEFSLEELKKRKIEDVEDLDSGEYNFGLIGKYYQLADGTNLYLPGRTDEVLKRMEDLKYISEEQKQQALTEVQNYVFNEYVASIKAPHFVFYVKELLEEKYGKDLVENGGLRVYTTLDYDLYEESRKILEAQVASNAKNYKAGNAALISINPSTGEILSMVGSANYNNAEIDGSVNMTTAVRQPGSSFKPIVYAASFLKGFGPGSVMYDVPTKLDQDTPRNYDGTFRGPMSIRSALGQSRNIPAIKAYYIAGEQDAVITLSENMGISTLDRRRDYGWPLALGSGEVKMIDMAQAFGVFANNGDRVEINPILRVEDNQGKTLENYELVAAKKTKVLDPQIAYLINSILSDRTVNLGGGLNLANGRVAGVKTGTSTKKVGDQSFPSNLWTVGYTPQIVTAVWAGNSNGEEMTLNADGYNAAVPIWNKVMNYALRNSSKVDFQRPEGIVNVQLNKLSGKLPSANTPENLITNDIFASTNVPKEVDDSFARLTVDTRNNKIPNAYCPQDFVKEVTFYNPKAEIEGRFNWQAEIISWFNGLNPEQVTALNLGENVVIGRPVNEESELCNPELAGKALDITVINLENGQRVPNGSLMVNTNVQAEAGVEKVEFYFNDELQAETNNPPFSAELRVPVGFQNGRQFKVKVKVIDRNGYSKETEINLITDEEAEAPSLDALPEIESTIEYST